MTVFASFWRAITVMLSFALFAVTSALAEDASIDRLLNKLPPPEKLVKPPILRAMEQPDPAFKDPIGRQVLQAVMTDNFPQALYLNRKLTQRYPRSLGAQYLRGVLAWTFRQYGEASSSFRAATNIQPRFAPAHFGLAAVEGAQDHFAAAIPHLQRVVELEPKSYLPYFALSDCAWQLGRKEQSVQYAKKATLFAPSVMDTWIELARAEKSLGHKEATLDAISKAAEVAPDSASMLAVVGYNYIELNRVPQAIAPLQRAARLAPRDYLIQSQLGYCLATTGQLDAGITYLRKGASLAPNYGPVWEHLGLAYQKKGNHRDAVKAFERATQLAPSRRLPWQHLSEEYRAVGRLQDAERAAARAQSLPAAKRNAGAKRV